MKFLDSLAAVAITAGTATNAQLQFHQMVSQTVAHMSNNKHTKIGSRSRGQRHKVKSDNSRRNLFRGIKKRFSPEDPSIKVIAADVGVLPSRHRQISDAPTAGERFLEGSTTCDAGFVECEDGHEVVDGARTGRSCGDACGPAWGRDRKCCEGAWLFTYYYSYYYEACEGFTGKICKDGSSCNGYEACNHAKIDHVVNSCNGELSCAYANLDGHVVDSCHGEYSCLFMGDKSCIGLPSCIYGEIGNVVNSCHGEHSCTLFGRGAQVGNIINSCSGKNSCASSWGYQQPREIGDMIDSCHGEDSCKLMAISGGKVGNIKNSCLAESSCAGFGKGGGQSCAGDIKDSCNSTSSCADAFQDVDTTGPLTDCCNSPDECAGVTTQPAQCASPYDECVTLPPLPLQKVGDNGNPSNMFPLGPCQGDCDNDNECQGALVCFTRSEEEGNIGASIPGCSGDDASGDDFCTVRPWDTYLAYLANHGEPQDAFPLKECEGDCKNNSDCDGDLICFKRNKNTPGGGGFAPVPGCDGLGVRGKDYCIRGEP